MDTSEMMSEFDYTSFVNSWNVHPDERMDLEILDEINSPTTSDSASRQGSPGRLVHDLYGLVDGEVMDGLDDHHERKSQQENIRPSEHPNLEDHMSDIESISGHSNFTELELLMDDACILQDDDSSDDDIYDRFEKRERELEAKLLIESGEPMPSEPSAPSGPVTPLIFGGVCYDNVPRNKFPLRSKYFVQYEQEVLSSVSAGLGSEKVN